MHIEEVYKQTKSNSHNMVATYDYDHMLYVRLFEGCNLHCEHCFIPSNPKKIELNYYKNNNLTEELIKNGRVAIGSKVYIQWHGGEPTLLGVNYLKEAIENVQKDNRFKYMHGIQTNLYNFNIETDKWVDLYKTYFGSEIGISWDFGIRHVKSNELNNESNQKFENVFWNNVELAKSKDLNLYMVITATKLFFNHYKNPFDFFDFIVSKGITKLNFERITKTGYARESWSKLGLSNLEYSTYMSKFYRAYLIYKNNNPEIDLNISPFDGLLISVLGMIENKNIELTNKAGVWDILSHKNQGYGCWSGECDTKFHTIDSNGYKHGCTALTSEQDNSNKKLESLEKKKIIWIGNNSTQRDNIIKDRNNRQESCDGCKYITICSSGCLSIEKFDESGECSGAKTLFNTIYESAIINLGKTNE